MLKKIAVIAFFAIGLSTVAFAAKGDLAPDNYGSGGGSAATAPSSSYSPNIFSSTGSIYVGGQIGFANLNYPDTAYLLSSNSVDGNKFAGRLFAGYAFSQFLAAELGYTYYGKPEFTHNPDGNTQTITQQGLDLSAKGTLPLAYGFGFYLRGGLAWIHRSTLNSNNGFFVGKDANGKITPVGAVGLSYTFAPHMAFDISWTKTMSMGDLPSANLYALGFIYHFNK